mgnify:CR=1 FL=1
MSEPRKLYTGSASGGLDQEQYEAAAAAPNNWPSRMPAAAPCSSPCARPRDGISASVPL